jgi:heme exporter protein B
MSAPAVSSPVAALFRRELALAFGKGGGPLLACGFYAAVAVLLPLAEGPDPKRLAAVAPGAAFVALALASLLSLEKLFERDFEDGALDLLALGEPGLAIASAVKCLAQWLATGAPLAFAAPLVAIALGAAPALAPIIFLTSLLAGLGFSFIGGIGASLALGARRGGVLVAVIVLPLFTPLVVFGAGAVDALTAGMEVRPALALLGAYALASAALSPLAMAAACRNALS